MADRQDEASRLPDTLGKRPPQPGASWPFSRIFDALGKDKRRAQGERLDDRGRERS